MKLEATQEWMHKAICESDEKDSCLQWLKSTHRLNGEKRLAIYQGMYQTRMIDALRSDYDLLEFVLGEEIFESLVLDYVATFPSQSFTLSHLGNNFPEYVGRCDSLPVFAKDICAFQYAIVRSFDAQDVRPFTLKDLKTLSLNDLNRCRVQPVPSFIGEAFGFDIDSFYTRFLKNSLKPNEKPEKKESYVLFLREDYNVKRLPVSAVSWMFYQGLQTAPSFGDALDPVLQVVTAADSQQALLQSFYEWTVRSLLQQTHSYEDNTHN